MSVNNQDFAIVIGIETYPQLPMLGAAESDAVKFAAWLVSPTGGGLPSAQVRMITSPKKQANDPADALPIQRDIDRVLRDWGVKQNKRIGRRLYFYFSGHGVGPTFNDVAMLMADASPQTLRSNIGLQPYLNFFRETGLFDEVVFITDCCRDPTRADIAMPPVFTLPPKDPPSRVLDVAVLAAAFGSKAFEVGGTPPEERRGILTKALLEALTDRPSVDAQGRVTALTLKRYIIDRVKELAAKQGKDQTPEFLPMADENMVFGVAPAPQTPVLNVRVQTPPGFTGRLILRNGDYSERASHEVTTPGGAWEFVVPRNSTYAVERADNGSHLFIDPHNVKDDPYVIQL